MSLLSRDLEVARPGDGAVPLTLRQLLADLGQLDASKRDQRAAVDAWLETHEPNKVLALNLRRHGFPPRRRARASAA